MIINGDALTELKKLKSESVDCVVTSPPYFRMRDYDVEGQIGLENSPEEYVEKLVEVFREVKRVLKENGVLWINIGDSYAGSWGNQGRKDERGEQREINGEMKQDFEGYGELSEQKNTASWVNDHPYLKPKDLIGVPWMLAFALQKDGWYLRQDIIWNKLNPMPESVTDRCVKCHEYVFLLSKSKKYHFNHKVIRERSTHAHEAKYDNGLDGHGGGVSHEGQGSSTRKFGADPTLRNKRSVWSVATKGFKLAHFATFPPKLIEPMILAGCPVDGVVLDPFFGAGTVGVVCKGIGRNYIGIELNKEYCEMAQKRIDECSQ